MKIQNTIFTLLLTILIVASILAGCNEVITPDDRPVIPDDKPTPPAVKPFKEYKEITKFSSGEELVKAFEEAKDSGRGRWFGRGIADEDMALETAVAKSAAAPQAAGAGDSGRDYSETNIQVEGVDEADIIKTDGDYIYTIAQGNLVIIEAYPARNANILSTTKLDDFSPRELFIHKNRLLIFGSTNYRFENQQGKPVGEIMPYPRYVNVMSVKLFDISDREDPILLKIVDFEGSYLTSRKIGSNAYFVVNSYPHYYRDRPPCEEIIPLYWETKANEKPKLEDMEPIARCVDIGYIEPIQASNFITIASISMTDEDKDVEKEVIVGSGQNVYASLENLYIAQTSWPRYNALGRLKEDAVQKTVITKFALDDGEIGYMGTGDVKGHILNQFSMDEYDNHFRIATTISGYSNNQDTSTNNMYVLDEDLNVVGELEGIAPGESIYSVRFMGKRGYMVTFRHIDPLFVIDLSDPENPEVLGKLKIPGYSDYLHPYDETHLIGIGKEVDASIDADKVHTEGAVYYTAIQGVKLAIFDVSDVENPIEMYKEVIGDRGTESPATSDHKAFLFDKDRELLIIPMTVAELKPGQAKNMQGEYTFQGAYVYDINLKDGFDLRGRVTHYDDDEAFKKSGYYFRGDSSIKRSLYIEDVLYTLSNNRLQLNDLDDLERLKVLEFEKGKDDRGYPEVLY